MLGFRYFIPVSMGVAVALSPNPSFASPTIEIVSEPTPEAVKRVTEDDFSILPSLTASQGVWQSLPEFLQPNASTSWTLTSEQFAQLPTFESDSEEVAPNEADVNQLEETAPGEANPDVIPGIEDAPAPDIVPPNLIPSANPLYFPTLPEQVDTELVQPITLDQAIAIARENNQDLEVARFNIESAQARLEEALAGYSPIVGTNAELTRVESPQAEIQQEANPTQGNNNVTPSLSARVEASYDLLTGGRRPALVKAAEEQLRFNQLDFERVAEELRFQVATSYYNLQEADALVEVAQADVEEAQQSLRDAQLLEEAGLGTRFDVLRAEVQLANANQDLERTLADQLIRRQALVDVIGLGGQVTLTTAEDIDKAGEWALSLPESIVLAYRNRAELEQQLAQREISQQQIEVALSGIRPTVSLFSNYSIVDILDDNVGAGDGFTLGARMQWTFLDGGAAEARADQERANVAAAESRFDNTRSQIRLEVEQAFYNLQANEENIDTAGVAVELAEESLRLARLRFQAGVGTQTDVIAAQSDLTEARVNLVRAIIDYNRDLAELRRAVSNVPDGILFDLP